MIYGGMNRLRGFDFGILCLMAACMTWFFPSGAAAQGYSFVMGGFGNKVAFTNAEGEGVVQVSQSISDYLFDELAGCSAIELYDATPVTTQARADEVAVQLELGSMPPEFKNVSADYIISGYLSNIGITYSEFFALIPGGRSYKLRVDIAVKIYDSSNGRCIYTAVGKGEAASEDFDMSLLGLKLMHFGDSQFSGECYDAALQKAVKQVADKIKRDI